MKSKIYHVDRNAKDFGEGSKEKPYKYFSDAMMKINILTFSKKQMMQLCWDLKNKNNQLKNSLNSMEDMTIWEFIKFRFKKQ